MADNSGTGSNGVCVTFKDCEDAIQNCPSSAPPPPPSCDTKDSVYFSVPFMQKVTRSKLFFLINFLSFIHIFCSVVDGLMSIYVYVQLMAEILGTYFMIFAGCAAVVVNLNNEKIVSLPGISIVWGLVVMVLVYSLGHISGAHFNPSVTIAHATCKRFPWKQVHLLFFSLQFLIVTVKLSSLRDSTISSSSYYFSPNLVNYSNQLIVRLVFSLSHCR